MSKRSLAVALFCLFVTPLSASGPVLAQQASSNAETSMAIQSSIADRLAIPPDTVTIAIRAPLIEVSIQSLKPKRTRADYTNEASMVEEEVVKQIANNPEYQSVHTIRINYMRATAAGRPKLLRSLDYRRNAHGLFEKHAT